MKKLSIFFFCLCCVASCSDKNAIPKDVLPKDKMRDVMWSMLSAGEYLNAYVLKDSIDKVAESSKVYGEVFQIHHITRQDFDKSYAYYRQHPDLMKIILDSLSRRQTYDIERFQRKQDSARKKIIQKEPVQ